MNGEKPRYGHFGATNTLRDSPACDLAKERDRRRPPWESSEEEKVRLLGSKKMIVGIWRTREVSIDGKELSPHESQKLRNHSPDGFAWGYGGSGPAQLALAILLHYTSAMFAMEHYQNFKWEVIASLPQSDFTLEEVAVHEWIFNVRSIPAE